MVFDHIERWRKYFSGPIWECAFEFLENIGPDAEEGYTKLRGDDVFSRVMSYPTRTPEDAIIESHRDYIDIQMALVNAEGIHWFPTDSLEPEAAYDTENDRILYHHPDYVPARIDVHPRTFAVLFPDDAHMPQLIVNDTPGDVKKVVVKVKADLVGTKI